MADFTWAPSRGFSNETSSRVNVAKFGDGYSQRVPQGINNLEQKWTLTFQNNSIQTINEIEAFLKSKLGSQAFTWRPAGESADVTVVCAGWTKVYDSEIGATINTSFERVYGYT